MHRTFLYQLGRMILTQEITDTSYLLKMTLVDLESKEYSKGLKIEIQWQSVRDIRKFNVKIKVKSTYQESFF